MSELYLRKPHPVQSFTRLLFWHHRNAGRQDEFISFSHSLLYYPSVLHQESAIYCFYHLVLNVFKTNEPIIQQPISHQRESNHHRRHTSPSRSRYLFHIVYRQLTHTHNRQDVRKKNRPRASAHQDLIQERQGKECVIQQEQFRGIEKQARRSYQTPNNLLHQPSTISQRVSDRKVYTASSNDNIYTNLCFLTAPSHHLLLLLLSEKSNASLLLTKMFSTPRPGSKRLCRRCSWILLPRAAEEFTFQMRSRKSLARFWSTCTRVTTFLA